MLPHCDENDLSLAALSFGEYPGLRTGVYPNTSRSVMINPATAGTYFVRDRGFLAAVGIARLEARESFGQTQQPSDQAGDFLGQDDLGRLAVAEVLGDLDRRFQRF